MKTLHFITKLLRIYPKMFRAAGVDLQSAPLNRGSVIRIYQIKNFHSHFRLNQV